MIDESIIGVRPIQAVDIERIIELAAVCGLSFWSRAAYLEEIADPNVVHCAVFEEDRLIGFIISRLIITQQPFAILEESRGGNAQRHDSLIDEDETEVQNIAPPVEAEIYNIAVDQKFRGRGIGKFLLTKILEILLKHGQPSIWLEVRESNFEAIRFYAANSFKIVYTRKNYYRDPPENAVVMNLDLTRGQNIRFPKRA